MQQAVERGIRAEGILPGGLNVNRNLAWIRVHCVAYDVFNHRLQQQAKAQQPQREKDPPRPVEKPAAKPGATPAKGQQAARPPSMRVGGKRAGFSSVSMRTTAATAAVIKPTISLSVSTREISIRGAVVVKELALKLGVRPNRLIADLMQLKVLASIN